MAQEQGDQQQENMLSSKDKSPKTRHRASIACSSCRDRRTRCVVPTGESKCLQCEANGHECRIQNDDQRRKPNSRAYVDSLRERINHLESMLEDREQKSSESHSPRSQRASTESRDGFNNIGHEPMDTITTDTFDFAMPPLSAEDLSSTTHHDFSDLAQHELSSAAQRELSGLAQHDFLMDAHSPANSAHSTSSSNKSTMVTRLLSTKGHLSFDQLSGRLRYYGVTANCHVHSELAAENEEHNRQAMEQRRRTQRVLSTLPQETQTYLMDMFWQYYNSVIHIIHRAAFEEGLNAGQGQFYSPFLHICVLGIGYRHADKQRPDIMKISLPGKESTLHREAKYMLDYELERPGGITSVQALLLLGDLECGVGRDNLGWLISGMANRLCFDIGLHLDNSASGLSQLEVEIGRMTLWACVIYDRYWALFLGRPTAMKPEDLEVYRLAAQFERLGTLEPAGPTRNPEKQIYEALLDLMELAGKITEIMDKATKPNARLDQHIYITVAALNRELETWYARLPRSLQWINENINGAPFSYFLLHQQYHAAMILLHRQFALYDDVTPTTGEQGSDNTDHSPASSYFATLSRTTCTRSAGRIAQIFWQHRQQYPTRKIFVTGLQHAGTAAIALVAVLASPKDRASYDTNMKYLECLSASIDDMCETYQPAERMSAVLKAVLEELKAARPQRTYTSLVPARRDSSTERSMEENYMPQKRHQSKRPGVSRTASQLSHGPVFLTEQSRRHTTTGMAPPSISPFQPRDSAHKAASHVSSSSDGFVLVPADTDTADIGAGWPKFDDPNPFAMDDNAMMSGFGRPASPSQFGSAWMGAETPTLSPNPTGTSAPTFLNQTSTAHDSSSSERQAHANNQNIFTSTTNLDFMALLNANDHQLPSTDPMPSNQDPSSVGINTNPFPSLPTPTSQTADLGNTNEAPATKSTPAQRSKSRQRPGSRSSQIGAGVTEDRSFTRTMAGLDDIWKEMMRTNQHSAGSASGKR